MLKDQLVLKGQLRIIVFDPESNVIKEEKLVNNLVVTGGKGFITSRMKDATSTVMSHMAIGNNNTAASGAQTALLGELGRVALTSTTQVTTTTTNDSLEYIATFPAGTGTGSITEAGVFNNSPGGTMLCRSVFGTITKNAGDAMTVTWKIVLTAS